MVKFINSICSLGLSTALFGVYADVTKLSRHDDLGVQRFQEDNNGRYYLQDPNFSYWMDTKDDILSEFKNYMQQAEKRLGSTLAQSDQDKSLKTLQRFAELVDMIMYLQKVPFFGQYWYYGCWCAPEGFFNTAKQGYGKPVDAIDRSCRSMSYCYECAQLDHGAECNTEEISYRWHGAIDDAGKKVIFCDDDPNTCEYSLCSCDKTLAEQLAEHEDKWNLHHHHKWGEFNRDACFITEEGAQINHDSQTNLPTSFETADTLANKAEVGARAFGGLDLEFGKIPAISLKFASTFANPDEKYCCGEYGNRSNNRKPIKKQNKEGSIHNEQCCYANSYSDGTSRFVGTPYNTGTHTCDRDTGNVAGTGT